MDIPYLDIMQNAQIPHLVPWYILAALAWGESKFDPCALSKAGAWGMFQFMPKTWAEWGKGNPLEPLDAAKAAAEYLKHCRISMGEKGKEWKWIIAAYNLGPARAKSIEKWEDVPEPTRSWVERVIEKAREYRKIAEAQL